MLQIETLAGAALMLALLVLPAVGQKASSEQAAARYLESVRHQPSQLLAFIREMPKGGDLHNHLSGAVYAESYIDWAAADGLCVDPKTDALVQEPCSDQDRPPVSAAFQDPWLYRDLVDAFSMRDWTPARESGHDHFFATFYKFDPATTRHAGDMLAEVASRAADDRVTYLELMLGPDHGLASQLGKKTGWEENLADMRKQLLGNGMEDVVAEGRRSMDEHEAQMRERLHCGKPDADAGCGVTIRYLYQVLRGLAPEQVFAQILAGFEMAQADPRVVGLNLVMPEDWYVPMHDFSLHMRMVNFLHELYPKVHISLHAGELAAGMVPPDGLRFHIRQSVEMGHAERIGHGVDVMHERDPIGLLREMARRNVLVEICLTSNDMILGVRGQDHPLPMYMKYGVPVALATDDEGVARSNMTREYLRAVETYGLSYAELKRMARASLEHSFLPGASLWRQTGSSLPAEACAADSPARESVSAGCRKFLDANEKAKVQWGEEAAFDRFERQF